MIAISCRNMGRRWLSRLMLCVALLLLGMSARPASAVDIVVKEIGGAPVMRCKVRYGSQTIDIHVAFDMNLQVPMMIHRSTIGGLGLDPAMANGKMVDLEFDANTRLKGIPIQTRQSAFLERMTAEHADELDQVPLAGMIGLQAFKDNVIELDMQRGLLRTLQMASDEARAVEMDYLTVQSGVLINATGPAKTPVKALLATKWLDSRMTLSLLEKARAAGEKQLVLKVGDIDFGRYSAFRFSPDAVAGDTTGATVVLGLGAIRNFAVTIWPKREKIAFVPRKAGDYPREEQKYFYALIDKNPAGILEFIEGHNKHRLLDEALINLWKTRSEDPSCTTEELKKILDQLAAKYGRNRRALALSQVSDALEVSERADRDELSLYALELAMAQSGEALNHSMVHGVHLRLGKRALAKGDLKTARRHLLSAAFGLPKNAECNFWLAEVYREMGKDRRAWSRYYQAILDENADDEIKAEALKRIELLNSDPEFRRTFTMLMAEQYTSGRSAAGEFHAPYRYKLEKSQFPGHVRLFESFVNSNDPVTASQQLALRGLDEYFEGDVAIIEYHLDDSMHSDIAVHRLEYYSATDQPLVVFDGQSAKLQLKAASPNDRVKLAKATYDALRKKCLLDAPVSDSGWAVRANLARKEQTVSGTVAVTGKGETDTVRLHAVLCERSVMAVQENGVLFHRFVARQALTPPQGTAVADAVGKPLAFSIDADALAEQINRPGTYVDARLLVVVAFLQCEDDKRILAAESFGLPQEEEIL